MEGEGNGVDLWAVVCWLRLCSVVGGRGSQLREGIPGVWLVCCGLLVEGKNEGFGLQRS
jgi:hypothetical protein